MQSGHSILCGGEPMLKALLGFLFGKQTLIFNKKGRVEHDLGKNKWDQWHRRLADNPNYDYRNHAGRTGAPQQQKHKSANH
jgi:hypothetical protein